MSIGKPYIKRFNSLASIHSLLSKQVFPENKARQIFQKNEQFLPGGKKCLFFEKFGVLCFVETLVLRLSLLPYYRLFSLCIVIVITYCKTNEFIFSCFSVLAWRAQQSNLKQAYIITYLPTV